MIGLCNVDKNMSSRLSKFLDVKNRYTINDGVKEVLAILKNKIIADPYKDYYYDTLPDVGGNKNE